MSPAPMNDVRQRDASPADEPVVGHLCGLACPVAHVMHSPPVFSHPEITLRDAAAVMRSKGLGSLILLRQDGPSAIVTERDVVQALADGADPDVVWAIDLASLDLVSVAPEGTIGEAINTMASLNIHHLPVKRSGEVVGMVSAADIVITLNRLWLITES